MSKRCLVGLAVMGSLLALSGCTQSPAATAPGSSSPTNSVLATPELLKATQLQAALLPVSVYDPTLTVADGYPRSADDYTGDPALHQGCLAVAQPLAAVTAGIGSQSQAVVWAHTTTGRFLVVTEQAHQFQSGNATQMMRNLAKRIDGDCGSFAATDSSGDRLAITTRETAVADVGDQAVRIEVITKFTDGPSELTQVVWARYGDVVICVSYSSTDIASARSFDLATKIKQIAAKLVSSRSS